MSKQLLIKGGRIIDPGQVLDMVGDILIADGIVAAVGERIAPTAPCPTLQARGMVVCPGLIDLHTHLREPGEARKETIASGTLAAARGGFTTVCAMPNTHPPTDTAAAVRRILERAELKGSARVLPIGCVTAGRRGEELVDIAELVEAGAVALSDDGSAVADSKLMRAALEGCLPFDIPVIQHCEEPALSQGGVMNEGDVATELGLKGIPETAEEIMVARDAALAEMSGGRVHIAHASTAGSVTLIRRAKEKGIAITAEVTPHHLTLTQERVRGFNTDAKVNPPLRTERDVRALVGGLRDGVIDAIATDHAPHTKKDKRCKFGDAAFGISGLETALGSVLALAHSGDIELTMLISKLTVGPAGIIGREDLGTLKVGAAGDVTVFDPDAEWEVDPSAFASKGRNTPLTGQTLKGRVMATVYGGEIVYRDAAIALETARGKANSARGTN